ncbi:MAG: FecR domain-containing protein, partial [Pontibacterium sp.]
MKNTIRILLALACLVAGNQAFAQVIGKALVVLGQAEKISADGANKVSLKVGDEIEEKDFVQTKAGGIVQIGLKDGTFIAVRPNTTMSVDEFILDKANPKKEKQVTKLFAGSIQAVTGGIGKRLPTNVSYTTPTATMGIRGTDLSASFNAKTGLTAASVNSGKVQFQRVNNFSSFRIGGSLAGIAPTLSGLSVNTEYPQFNTSEEAADKETVTITPGQGVEATPDTLPKKTPDAFKQATTEQAAADKAVADSGQTSVVTVAGTADKAADQAKAAVAALQAKAEDPEATAEEKAQATEQAQKLQAAADDAVEKVLSQKEALVNAPTVDTAALSTLSTTVQTATEAVGNIVKEVVSTGLISASEIAEEVTEEEATEEEATEEEATEEEATEEEATEEEATEEEATEEEATEEEATEE